MRIKAFWLNKNLMGVFVRKPVNFIWGCEDDVFNEAWGRLWAKQMNATFDAIPDAGHFLQNTHGEMVAGFILSRGDVD